MPRFTVDTFNPSLIRDQRRPTSEDHISKISEGIRIALEDYDALRASLSREVGAGDTILAALEDFAAIGWEEPPDVLLKTVVWVRDEVGRIVATGHYRIPEVQHSSTIGPFLELTVSEQSSVKLYRCRKIRYGDSYRVELT